MPFADFLTQTAAVLRRANARNGFAPTGPPLVPVAGQAALPCLVRPLRAEALARQNRDASEQWSRIYLEVDPNVTNDHVLKVDGRLYAVKGQLDFNSEHEVYAVDCILTTS